jgi:predicted ribonuclease YlaK
MLKLILVITLWFQKEQVSLQREILNRMAKKRPLLDYSNHELMERYEHANRLIKDRRTKNLKYSGIRFLLDHPRTALNLMNGKKIPIAEFDTFRKCVESKGD